ncbi:hypothetical protein DX912_05335 [Lysobacter soli]|uniref:Uncharacterized protein n=1 Tax=Lysobacter soli TaxID=453783 RepID=A0A3D8VIH1_9GAMM|nr:hypothetical protein DX912_05335 [Lysobacter soli]
MGEPGCLQAIGLRPGERPERAAEGRIEDRCLQGTALHRAERPEPAAEAGDPLEAAYATRRSPAPCLSP